MKAFFRKSPLFLVLIIVGVFVCAQGAYANELRISTDGEVSLVEESGAQVLGSSSSSIHITVSVTPPQHDNGQISVGFENHLNQETSAKEVDQVVVEQPSADSIIITPSGNANELLIRQGAIIVYSSLRLRADPGTQTIQVLISGKPVNIISQQLMAERVMIQNIMNPASAKIRLVAEGNQVDYVIEGRENMRFMRFMTLGFPIKLHVSAVTGKIRLIYRHWFSALLWEAHTAVAGVFKVKLVETIMR